MSGTFKPVRRSRATADLDSDVNCYLAMEGRVTLRELCEYFTSNPHVNAFDVELNFATAVWPEPSTADERREWADWKARHAERHEAWERAQYAKLKAKFEPARPATEAKGKDAEGRP